MCIYVYAGLKDVLVSVIAQTVDVLLMLIYMLCALITRKQKRKWLKVQNNKWESRDILDLDKRNPLPRKPTFPRSASIQLNLMGSTFLGDGNPTKPGGGLLAAGLCGLWPS